MNRNRSLINQFIQSINNIISGNFTYYDIEVCLTGIITIILIIRIKMLHGNIAIKQDDGSIKRDKLSIILIIILVILFIVFIYLNFIVFNV